MIERSNDSESRGFDGVGTTVQLVPGKDALRALLVQRAERFGLTSDAIDQLVLRSQLGVWRPNQTVFAAGDRADLVRLLVAGAVRLEHRTRHDRTMTVRIVPSGHVLSWSTLVDGEGPSRFAAIAHVPSLVAIVSRSVLRSVSATLSAERAARVMGHCARVLHELLDEKCHMFSMTLRERLEYVLEILVRDFGRPDAGGARIELPLTHEHLAGLVVASRPNVSRAMAALQSAGVVQKSGARLWVRTASR